MDTSRDRYRMAIKRHDRHLVLVLVKMPYRHMAIVLLAEELKEVGLLMLRELNYEPDCQNFPTRAIKTPVCTPTLK